MKDEKVTVNVKFYTGGMVVAETRHISAVCGLCHYSHGDTALERAAIAVIGGILNASPGPVYPISENEGFSEMSVVVDLAGAVYLAVSAWKLTGNAGIIQAGADLLSYGYIAEKRHALSA